MKLQLLYPMGLYVFYIWFLLMASFRVRKQSLNSKKLRFSYFKTYLSDSEIPENVRVYGRHVDNQFQAPMIFFITCLTYIAMPLDPKIGIFLAWAFVLLRFAHSFIHLGSNNVLKRAATYTLGWLCLLGMWVEILVSAVTL